MSLKAVAQLDTIHWIPPMFALNPTAYQLTNRLYLSTPETAPVSYTITDGAGNVLGSGTLTNSNPVIFNAGSNAPTDIMVTTSELNTVLPDRGLIVTASDSVYANFRSVTFQVNNGNILQGASLTAKGRSALGTEFRIGGIPNECCSSIRSSFFSVMATQDNTNFTVTALSPGMIFNGTPAMPAATLNYSLNAGESMVFSVSTDDSPTNVDGLLGAHFISNNPVVINNGTWHSNYFGQSGQDAGIDQTVPVTKLGTDFISVRGGGVDSIEYPLIIAHFDNTQIFVNGSGTPLATINAGDYYPIVGSYYSAGENMYIQTSQPAYCYQSLAGSSSTATGGMNFIPPISCGMPKTVDLIPNVNKVAGTTFIGGITAVTTIYSSLTVTDANGSTTYPAGSGNPVPGAPNWQTFKIQGLIGHTKLISTGAMSASIFGANNAAGFAGYFSGFDADIHMDLFVNGDTCLNSTLLVGSSIFENYEWYLDGQLIPGENTNSITPLDAGTYKAWGIFNGCPDSIEVEVYPLPIKPLSDTALCDQNPLTLDASSAGVEFDWSTGETTPTISPTTSGTYWVDITTDHACTDRDTAEVEFFVLPIVDLGSNVNICSGLTTTLDASPDFEEYLWNDGSTQQTLDVSQPGIYYVTITDSNACQDSDTLELLNYPLPVFDFEVNPICEESLFNPTNNSYVPNGGALDSTIWTLGDGSISDDLEPQHVYTTSGQMNMTLRLLSTNGCEIDTAFANTVYPKPEADFSVQNVCEALPVPIQNSSSVDAPGQIQTSTWNMGDQTIFPDTTLTEYQYAGYGFYTVQLALETTDGCQDTLERQVAVHPLPEADFSFNNICEIDSVLFNDQSSIPQGDIVDWQWDFGNGNTAISQVVDYQNYPADDLYPIELVVESDSGCVDVFNDTIEIYPNPIANFTFDSVCFPVGIQFTDLSDPNGVYNISAWLWNYTDNQTSVQQSPQISFAQFGAYGATLTVTNAVGCKDDTTLGDALVHPLPVADYVTQLGHCHHDTATFLDQSTLDVLSDDEIVEWVYDYGDGNFESLPNLTHVYQDFGFYPSELLVTTNHGCKDSLEQVIEVWPRPVVSFSADPPEGCQPLFVEFIDGTTIPSPYALAQWQWDLGDGTTSSAQEPSLTYNPYIEPLDEALYDISLKVTSGNGCADSLAYDEMITVYPKPTAKFATSPDFLATVVHPLYQMDDQSTINVTDWDWDFGDGGSAYEQNPEYLYSDTGTYQIQLIAITEHDCTDTISRLVKVEQEYHFYIPSSFTPNLDGRNDYFYGQGEFYSDYQMTIYNRWGEIIFHSNDAEYQWDGTYKGAPVEVGVYVYSFLITDWEGNQHDYTGGVTLLR